MKPNRSIQPEVQALHDVELLRAEPFILDNGIKVYWLNSGSQDVVKLEFLFKAGARFQNKPLVASAANSVFSEGTTNYSGEQIAAMFDYYGAFFQSESDYDYASISLFSLKKHIETVLPLLQDAIFNATFPEKEVLLHFQHGRQKFEVNLQKVAFLARKHFMQTLFGPFHTYGYFVQTEDFENISREDLVNFYRSFYNESNVSIIVSGRVDEHLLRSINSYFGKPWRTAQSLSFERKNIQPSSSKKHFISHQSAVQSAIRIGRPMFNRTHPDYLPMQVVNTIFGGYFGSRLMANIREEKGYTYGIGSGLTSLQEAGYFFISTEVGTDVADAAVAEIYKELRRMREEPVPATELQLVKNYLMGVFLRSIDGPFALAERFKALLEYDLEYHYYDHMRDIIRNITAEEIQQLSDKYLREEDMFEVVVGQVKG